MLRQELKDSNIPHHLTIRKRIDEVLEEHLTWLEEDMQVSWHSTSKFISYWWACKFRQHWVWSPKQWISGQIQTVHHTWWWLVIGSKEYIRKPSMAPGSHSSSGLISSVSNKSLVAMMGSTLPQLSCTLQIVLRLLTRWDINAQLCIFYSYNIDIDRVGHSRQCNQKWHLFCPSGLVPETTRHHIQSYQMAN